MCFKGFKISKVVWVIEVKVKTSRLSFLNKRNCSIVFIYFQFASQDSYFNFKILTAIYVKAYSHFLSSKVA